MKKLSFLIVMLLLAIGGFFAWFVQGTQAPEPTDTTTKLFSVEKGQTVREIAQSLKSENLIKDPVIFFLNVKRLDLEEKIQAGEFYLSSSMNATEIAEALQVGTFDMQVIIPEGLRADEIADRLEERIIGYDESWRGKLRLYEGYLFPDTYFFPKDANIDTIIETMRDNFDKKYNSIKSSNTKYSKDEIVTIASMIEREAKHDEDRFIVSSVIHNRLNAGMGVYIDATIQYAIGNPSDWWPKLTNSGSNIVPDSAYNTYTHAGLPPTPISNPGTQALDAALNPADTNYLYYITDKSGVNHYGRTLEEHNANIEKYGL